MRYELKMEQDFYGKVLTLVLKEDEKVVDEVFIWRAKDAGLRYSRGQSKSYFDCEGFYLIEFFDPIKASSSYHSMIGQFYIENEKEIKQEARKLIVKEML